MENLDTPEAQAYVFKMLDVKNDGFLDESTVYFYVKVIMFLSRNILIFVRMWSLECLQLELDHLPGQIW